MNRSFAGWLANNPGSAVFVTGLFGLLPMFGIGFAFFLPGAVPALLTLQRGPRAGVTVALGAALLLAIAMWMTGQPAPIGVVYAVWVLGPPLLLATLLGHSRSLSLCLQVATLAGLLLVVLLHVSLGDPARYCEPYLRRLATEMHKLPMPAADVDAFVKAFAPTIWGWIAVLTMMLAMCAVFLARWWQSLMGQSGSFAAEFRSLRLGRVLGTAAAVVIGLSFWLDGTLIDDLARLFLSALLLIGLAVVHRYRAERNLHTAWLWVTYVGLALASPVMVPVLAAWGFVDNWVRSGRREVGSESA
jgi:hypothetical protein